jgi:RNA polymerase sigma-70 factor (ECF subfamily)
VTARSNAEWLTVLRAGGAPQTAALIELRAFLLRASRYTLSRCWTTVSPATADVNHLAEDAAQEALSALLPRLDEFRGDSRFTTWAYKFAVNAAFVAARREGWRRMPLDRLLEGPDLAHRLGASGASADPHRRLLQTEMLAVLREAIETALTPRQRQALTAIVLDEVPLDELARRWGSNRNALYKLLHDARRKLAANLRTRGLDAREMLDAFGDDR